MRFLKAILLAIDLEVAEVSSVSVLLTNGFQGGEAG